MLKKLSSLIFLLFSFFLSTSISQAQPFSQGRAPMMNHSILQNIPLIIADWYRNAKDKYDPATDSQGALKEMTNDFNTLNASRPYLDANNKRAVAKVSLLIRLTMLKVLLEQIHYYKPEISFLIKSIEKKRNPEITLNIPAPKELERDSDQAYIQINLEWLNRTAYRISNALKYFQNLQSMNPSGFQNAVYSGQELEGFESVKNKALKTLQYLQEQLTCARNPEHTLCRLSSSPINPARLQGIRIVEDQRDTSLAEQQKGRSERVSSVQNPLKDYIG